MADPDAIVRKDERPNTITFGDGFVLAKDNLEEIYKEAYGSLGRMFVEGPILADIVASVHGKEVFHRGKSTDKSQAMALVWDKHHSGKLVYHCITHVYKGFAPKRKLGALANLVSRRFGGMAAVTSAPDGLSCMAIKSGIVAKGGLAPPPLVEPLVAILRGLDKDAYRFDKLALLEGIVKQKLPTEELKTLFGDWDAGLVGHPRPEQDGNPLPDPTDGDPGLQDEAASHLQAAGEEEATFPIPAEATVATMRATIANLEQELGVKDEIIAARDLLISSLQANTVNGNAVAEHEALGRRQDRVGDGVRERKRCKLVQAQEGHMKTVTFLKSIMDDSAPQLKKVYNGALANFFAVTTQINDHDIADGIAMSEDDANNSSS